MGKPTKPKQASKAPKGQNGHGHQSSIQTFFKRKSEMPSPLFTQVIPIVQKVIPPTPEPITPVKEHSVRTLANASKTDFTSSPFSQTIIPDTPDNVAPKKRTFTSLVTDRKPISGYSATRTDDIKCYKTQTSLKMEKERQPLSHVSNKVQLKSSNENQARLSDPPVCKLMEEDENSLTQITEHPSQVNKFSKLSRKFNKLAKSHTGNVPQKIMNGDIIGEDESDSANIEIDHSGVGEKALQKEGFELKPAIYRVQSNPFKKKTSRLSLSRGTLKEDSRETSVSSNKRSPLRGNSPFAKRFQGSKNGAGSEEPQNCEEGVDRVKKSLLEQYGKSGGEVCPGGDPARPLDKSHSLKAPCDRELETPEQDELAWLTGSGKSVQSMGKQSAEAEPAKEKALPINEDNNAETDGDNEKEDFVSVIPDTCPTPIGQHQEILVIPDTCPSNDHTSSKPQSDQPTLNASGSHQRTPDNSVTRKEPSKLVSGKHASVEEDSKDLSERNHAIHHVCEQRKSATQNLSEGGLLEGEDSHRRVSVTESIPKSRSRDIAALQDHQIESAKEIKTKGKAGPGIDLKDAYCMDSHYPSSISTEFISKQTGPGPGPVPQDETGLGTTVQHDPLDTKSAEAVPLSDNDLNSADGRSVPSPGTAALLEGLDDSFLDGLDLEELDLIEGGKQTSTSSNPVSNIEEKLAKMSPFKQRTTEGSKPLKKPEWRPADLLRFTVTGIKDNDYEKILEVMSMTDQSMKTCILKDTWQQTLVDVGMQVAIHGTFRPDGICEVTRQQGYLVVNPDHLLTGTAVSNSIRCMRRSVLSEHFKGLERGNRAMLLGSLLHEIFDQAILKNEFQKPQIMQIARDVLKQPAFLCDMYSLKVDENNLLEEVEEYADTIKRWSDTYLGSKPKGRMDIKWPGSMKSEQCGASVAKVVDIEETIWSPRWGVKGKVDLTVQVKINRPSTVKPVYHTIPLELKTGRETNSIEHRSQLILYSLMLGDLQPSPDLGFLLYLKTAAMKAVPANHLDKRELVHLRNQLAYHLSRRATSLTPNAAPSLAASFAPPTLPEPIQDDFTCSRCAHLQSCSMLQKLHGSGRQLSSTMQDLFGESINHLLDSHFQYFAHWHLLCALEHEATQKRNNSRNIWCKEATDRERDGECWSSMELQSTTAKDQQHGGFSLVFTRKQGSSGVVQPSLDRCVLTKGDRVVVSIEGTRRVAVCVGFIEMVGPFEVKVSTDSQLKAEACRGVVYRIDKDDSYNSMAASLVNLAKLMKPEHSRLRNIVIDKEAPTSIQKPNLPTRARTEVASIFKVLNEDQRAAIKAVLRSQDYTLIIGMPGTGKTTTIVALVRILVACDKSVLVTSYTHSAVDNILLKLTEHNIDFLRLGAQHNVHPELRQYSDSKLMKRTSGVSELATAMERKRVVATTSLGMKHALFTRHTFDVCIVDEASQISQPVCVGPLFSASKFVLVGDQCQLPPLVQSSRARDLGMDESLFQRLVSAHDSSAIRLRLQFRMHAEIMALSNHLVYDGAMRCGNEAVATATVSLPNWDGWNREPNLDSWLVDALDPSTVVSFLNTEQVSGTTPEQSSDNTNRLEARLVRRVVESLIQCGCAADRIGVISPYRRQCQLLTSTLTDLGSKVKALEVNTVDKYQGRDKDVIVVSFSHSKLESQGGSILKDLRRLNVAITRAKHKLLLIGSLKALRQFQPIQKLTDILLQRNLVRNLPASTGNRL